MDPIVFKGFDIANRLTTP